MSSRKSTVVYLFRELQGFVRPYWKQLLAGALALTSSNLALSGLPWLLGDWADRLKSFSTQELGWRLGLALAILFFGAFMQKLMRIVLVSVSRRAEQDIRDKVYSHMQKLSPIFYDRMRVGEILSRMTSDISAVREVLGPGIMYPLNFLTTVPVALGLMYLLSPALCLVTLVPMLLIPFLIGYFNHRIHAFYMDSQRLLGRMSAEAQESYAGIRVIKNFSQERSEKRAFSRLGKDYVRVNFDLVKTMSIFQPMLMTMGYVITVLIFIAGCLAVYWGKIHFGEFLAFKLLSDRIIMPLMMVSWVMSVYERGRVGMTRVNELLDVRPQILNAPAGRTEKQIAPLSVDFVHLNFSYDANKTVFKDLSLQLKQGEFLALTGPTGSGKSTLVRLLLRQYSAPSGAVRIDNTAVEDWDLIYLRNFVSYVDQEPYVFSASVADNIRFSNPDLSDEQVVRAACMAELDEDIESFPQKYQTRVGEKGVTLSGGQKLRLAIARAIAKPCGLLVLDDAFAAVDVHTESRLLNNLRAGLGGLSCLLISHRVSTLKQAQRIAVLEEGHISQIGRHEELIAQEGYYQRLIKDQQTKRLLEADD